MTEQRKRRTELSYLNLFYCVLVIFIHVTSEPVTALDHTSVPYYAVMIPWRLSSFVVQGFLFLSGVKLFLHLKEPFDTVTFWCKKIKTILIPYVLWVLVYYCYFVSRGYFPFSFRAFARYVALGDLVSPFYFIVIIMQFYLLAPLIVRLFRKMKPLPVLILSFILMIVLWQGIAPFLRLTGIKEQFLYSDRLFTSYLFYFMLGCVVGKYYDAVLTRVRKYAPLCALVFEAFVFIDLFLYLYLEKASFRAAEICHVFYCISAIAFTFTCAVLLAGRVKRPPRLIAAADRASYLVFLCHCFVINLINERMAMYGIVNVNVRYVIRIVVVYGVSFGGCILWQWGKKHFDARIAG